MEAGNEYTENCMRNAPAMQKFPWAYRLFEKFKQIPAIIVSAGPSLYYQLDQLKNLNEQAVIIAVDTAYPILKRMGFHLTLFVQQIQLLAITFIYMILKSMIAT